MCVCAAREYMTGTEQALVRPVCVIGVQMCARVGAICKCMLCVVCMSIDGPMYVCSRVQVLYM